MNSSRPMTLFEPPPQPRTGPSSFAVSVVTHGVVLGLMFLAISNAPRITEPPANDRYTVRVLTMHQTEPRLRWTPRKGGAQGATQAMTHAARSGGQPAAAASPRQLAQRVQSRQTLIQPNAPANLPLLDTNVPLVVMWTPESVPVPKIIPPPPAKAVATVVKPSIAAPNHEALVADIQLSSSAEATESVPLAASTTSPIPLHSTGATMVLQTASTSTGKPTPATVMSVSDTMLPQGTIAVPLANQIASASPSDLFGTGRPDSTADSQGSSATGKQAGTGAGGSAGDRGDGESAANGTPTGSGAGGSSGSETGAGGGSDHGSAGGDPFAVDRIQMAKDGNYGVVVIGASLGEEYPETLGIWAGRLAYTVYLHVGLTKNWILQYSLPRVIATAPNDVRPDAPWPYLMVRPHLMPTDTDADAIMVHGFINSGGRFEQLAVVFPPRFPQTKFVLGSLQQWQFRPAMQNGQHTPVEVLLIIPEETE